MYAPQRTPFKDSISPDLGLESSGSEGVLEHPERFARQGGDSDHADLTLGAWGRGRCPVESAPWKLDRFAKWP